MNITEAKKIFALNLGDDSLILSHRLAEWCGHGPELEEDIALGNIGLDLLGQCQSLLNYAGELEGKNQTADDLAYRRKERDFTNVLLVEQLNGHYGDTIARQFIYDTFHYYLLEGLTNSKDQFFAAFAQKSIKEVAYHLRHSTDWVLRLGDGTEESHQKMQEAIDLKWQFSGELFENSEAIQILENEGIIPSLKSVKEKFDKKVTEILNEATLTIPTSGWMATGGRKGIHSENMGYILTELQYLVKTYPDAKWD